MASCAWRNGHREPCKGKVIACFLIIPLLKKKRKEDKGVKKIFTNSGELSSRLSDENFINTFLYVFDNYSNLFLYLFRKQYNTFVSVEF